jgi:hypothetical protein
MTDQYGVETNIGDYVIHRVRYEENLLMVSKVIGIKGHKEIKAELDLENFGKPTLTRCFVRVDPEWGKEHYNMDNEKEWPNGGPAYKRIE